MGAGYHGGFGCTNGEKAHQKSIELAKTPVKKTNRKPIFNNRGHVTKESISRRREFFLGKSVAKIDSILQKQGYETKRRPSKHSGSNAKIIIILNSSCDRNISQVQISKGSKRHGNIPYVKISTTDMGKIKIIGAHKKKYKTDGNETAILLFRRYK